MNKNSSEQGYKLKEEFAKSPGYLVTQLSKKIARYLETALAPFELSAPEYGLLKVISVNGPVAQYQYGEHFSIDRSSVTAIVENLVKRDLIYKDKSSKDRRQNILHLTPRGRSVLSRAGTRVNKAHREFLSILEEEEWERCRKSLIKLLEFNH
jgi:DNA-binding MarR family transcriptional regulator